MIPTLTLTSQALITQKTQSPSASAASPSPRCAAAFASGSSSAGAKAKLMALAEPGSAGAALLLCFSIASGVSERHAPAWRPAPQNAPHGL